MTETISKAAMLAQMSQFGDPTVMQRMVDRTLAGLGWSDREAFTLDDFGQVAAGLIDVSVEEVARDPDWRAQSVVAKIGPMVEAYKDTLLPAMLATARGAD